MVWRATDVTDSEQVRAAVEATVREFGRLDIAFANAGVFGVVAPVSDYPVDVFERVIAVNVIGSFLVAKHALAAMADGGSLIVNSSVVGLTSDRGIAAYATSKHAVVGLVRTAAKEMASRGIRVNSLHPGPTDNEFQSAIEVEAIGASKRGVREGVRADDPARSARLARRDRGRGRVPRQRREQVHDRDAAGRGRGVEYLTRQRVKRGRRPAAGSGSSAGSAARSRCR